MKPAPFCYERAESLRGALEFLDAAGGGAKVLAGGQSLIALMNMRLARPEVVLDLDPIDDLRYQRVTDEALEIGALTTQAQLERSHEVAQVCPLLAQALPYIGHAAIRNRGTVGGSIAHADPAAELPTVLKVLGGWVTLSSTNGGRTVAAEDFFRGFLRTAASPNEIVSSVGFPTTGLGLGVAFEEFARRPGDFALASVACMVKSDGGAVQSARVALGGVAGVPLLVGGLDALEGATVEEAPEAAAKLADEAIDPVSDIHGSSDYRRHLTRELVKRAFWHALGGE